jgi:hypothetical protein
MDLLPMEMDAATRRFARFDRWGVWASAVLHCQRIDNSPLSRVFSSSLVVCIVK